MLSKSYESTKVNVEFGCNPGALVHKKFGSLQVVQIDKIKTSAKVCIQF